MLENPGDEVYFGEVYRNILQEPWLPGGEAEWLRVGKSRRGDRPSLRGITGPHVTPTQEEVRRWFSKCAAAWRELPWELPPSPVCDNRHDKKWWMEEKARRGLMCSYYDLYMRYCLRFSLDTGCIPPANYLLAVEPVLTDVQCSKVYDLSFPNKCGEISMVSGDGEFVSPGEWISPKWGTEGVLCFKDENGSLGSTTFWFTSPYSGDYISWPDTNPTEILFNETKDIYVTGGIPPYTWEVSGEGFTLGSLLTQATSNTLIAAPWTESQADIIVSDICGNPATGVVQSEPSNWVVCWSTGQGGCCYPPDYPCVSFYVSLGAGFRVYVDCGTRPGYGSDSIGGVCDGTPLVVTKSVCSQENAKLCGAQFEYWKGP